MVTQAKALERLKELRQNSWRQREAYEAFWAMQCIYDNGEQWGFVTGQNNQRRVRFLRNIIDPRRSDLRVTVNKIHEDVRTMMSKTTPRRIKYTLDPRGISNRDIQHVGKQLLDNHLRDIKALKVLRRKEVLRYVLGTAIVRRTLRSEGRSVLISTDGEGNEKRLRTIMPGLSLVYPYEIMRDPSAVSVDWSEDEDQFCHEKPRTVEWVKKHFGVTVEHPSPMGQLLHRQRRLEATTGVSLNRGAVDSKRNAVMVYEYYLKDPDFDVPGRWPWVLFGYLEGVSEGSGGSSEVKTLKFGRNPFFGLPFHGYHYDQIPQAPWGRGIPALERQAQDIINVTYTWLVRAMQQGDGKIMFPAGSVENPEEAFNNRLDQRIEYRPVGNELIAPSRFQGPQINPAVPKLLDAMPRNMKDSINIDPVLLGKPAGKRGESGKAIQSRIGEASPPLELIRQEDDDTTEDLVYGMWVDLGGKNLRLDMARKILGPDVPDEQIRRLVRADPIKAIKSVRVHQSMNRPRTPAETKNEYIDLAIAQIMPPDDAQWEIILRGGEINTAMRNSFDKQIMEISELVAGNDVTVGMADNHIYERKALEWYTSQPAWLSLKEEQQDAVTDHWNDHKYAEMLLAQEQGLMSQQATQQQPSPPGEAVQAASQAGAGAADPGIGIA